MANEVESEVILQTEDVCGIPIRLSSNVILRGSIPLYWHHTNIVNPKPDTRIVTDYGSEGSLQHFNNLFTRYGVPCVILNLIKQKDSRSCEEPLGEAFVECVTSLNITLKDLNSCRGVTGVGEAVHSYLVGGHDKERLTDTDRLSPFYPNLLIPTAGGTFTDAPIVYFDFDFLSAKAADVDVMNVLWEASNAAMLQVGFFYTLDDLIPSSNNVRGIPQCGIFRVNCMDCLDRTNVAQFCYSRSTLRHQMRAVDLLASESDYEEIWKILLLMFEEHGDAIAKQYSGSGAMHKATPSGDVTSSGNAMVALQRYYNNNITDVTKQQSYNFFHGVFIPRLGIAKHAWDDMDLMNNYLSSPMEIR